LRPNILSNYYEQEVPIKRGGKNDKTSKKTSIILETDKIGSKAKKKKKIVTGVQIVGKGRGEK
jgi:hypothetical protein